MAVQIEYVKHPKAAKREMIPGKEKTHKTVFTRMSSYTQGPLSMLKRAVDERRRIKVWTRSFRYVRGICTGYVVMFDKHFNLALTDVDEVCIDPMHQKKVFQLQQNESTRPAKKHKRQKKKTPTLSAVNLEIAKELLVKPTEGATKQTDVCDARAAALADRSIVGTEDLITDTMMSSLREVSDACLDDCTTMMGGIGSADIIGSVTLSLTDKSKVSANANDDCDLSMSTDGVHDKLRSSPRVTRRSTDTNTDLNRDSTAAAVSTAAPASTLSANVTSVAASFDEATAASSSISALQCEDNAMGFEGGAEEMQVLSANCVPPFVVEHELSIMATSDLASSSSNVSDFEVVDEVSNSSSTSEESLTELESKMQRIQKELAKLAAADGKKGRSKDKGVKKGETNSAHKVSDSTSHSAASRSRGADVNKSQDRKRQVDSKKDKVKDKEKEAQTRPASDCHRDDKLSASRGKRESDLKTLKTDLRAKLTVTKATDTKTRRDDKSHEHLEIRRSTLDATTSSRSRESSRHDCGAGKILNTDNKKSETDNKKSDTEKKTDTRKKMDAGETSAARSTRSGSRHADSKSRESGVTRCRQLSKDSADRDKSVSDAVKTVNIDDKVSEKRSEKITKEQPVIESQLIEEIPSSQKEPVADIELDSAACSNVFMARAQRKIVEAKKVLAASIASDNTSKSSVKQTTVRSSANALDSERESYDVFRRLRSDTDVKRDIRRKKSEVTAADSDEDAAYDDDVYKMTPRMQLPKDTSRLFSEYKPVCGTHEGLGQPVNLLRTRHVQQLFIRGDNVVMVAFADV